MPQIKDLGSAKTTLDGTEIVPIQEAAGGASSSKHATAANLLAAGSMAPVSVATLHVNASQIGTLHSSPTQILAAPGSGNVVTAVKATFEWKPGTCGFASTMTPTFFWSGSGFDLMDTPNGNGVNLGFLTPVAYVLQHNATAGSSSVANVARSLIENIAVVLGKEGATDPERAGPIVTSSLAAGGTGYAVGDTGTINTQAYTGGATYTVNTVSAGAVVTYTINSGGDGYRTTVNPVATTKGGAQAGSGSGFTINVNSIPAADGDIYATLWYYTLALH